jgi:hypothetical protein
VLHALNLAIGIADAICRLGKLLLQPNEGRLMLERAEAPDGKVLHCEAKGGKRYDQLLLGATQAPFEHVWVRVPFAREVMQVAAILKYILSMVFVCQNILL